MGGWVGLGEGGGRSGGRRFGGGGGGGGSRRVQASRVQEINVISVIFYFCLFVECNILIYVGLRDGCSQKYLFHNRCTCANGFNWY